MDESFDLCVIGAGSGGLGAALAGARLGLSVLLLEKADTVGGTATRGGVSAWEMGVGGTGLPFDLYRRLKQRPRAVGIYSFGRHGSWRRSEEKAPFPGGEQVIDPSRRYIDTLQRHIDPGSRADEAYRREHWHGVIFEPDAYCATVEEMLSETGRCLLLKGVAFEEAQADGGHVTWLRLSDGRRVTARAYVDATGDGLVCLACGAEALRGQDPRERFGEPHAPENANDNVNGVSLVYRVTRINRPGVEPLPEGLPNRCWWSPSFPWAAYNRLPSGDYTVNMLPTMEGEEFLQLGYQAAYDECRRRVLAHWHNAQIIFPEFQGYRLAWIAPMLGVRESNRLVGEYMLREQDLVAGISAQDHPDIITLVDHAIDRHGAGGGSGELRQPYGVPYRCLIPRGFSNLLIASRAAGFSSIAASSCRLSRTIMQFGQAAGTAVALANELGVALPQVPADRLRDVLAENHVELSWPRPQSMIEYLRAED